MDESVKEAKGKRDDSTGAIIQPLFAFGVAHIDYNVVYGDNQRIWYSIGRRIVGYDTSTKDMQFLPYGEHVQAVLQMCISPSKKYLAAIEQRSDAQPHSVSPAHQLTVFNMQKELPVRTLLPDKSFTPAVSIDCIAFSDNGKLLLMACGPPDFTILCWRWYSGKVIASVTPDCRTRMLAFNPWKEFEFAAMAAGVLRTYSLDKESDSFKATNVAAPVDGCEYTAMTWLYGPLLVVADSSASIAMYKAGELLEMHAELTPGSIAALVPRARGLLAAAASGQLLVLEPAEGGSRKQGSGTVFHVSSTMDLGIVGNQVLHMAISGSGNHITVCTNARELVFMQLENLHERQQTLAIVHPEFDEQVLGRHSSSHVHRT